MTALIDIGSNLTHRSFGADLGEVLHRARAEGVESMVVTGLSGVVSERAALLAEAHGLYATAGVHPHNASSFDASTRARLRALLDRPRVVAAGECGLDFNRDFSPRAAQRYAFESQLELAVESRRPVFLHERDAHDAFVAVLAPRRAHLVDGVVHCFTGRRDALHAYLELGLHIGITGWITDPRRGRHLLELAGEIPDDRLLIETDAPFLTPSTVRPRPSRGRNEPSFLPHVLRAVASARGEPFERVARLTRANARRLFRLDEADRRAAAARASVPGP